MQILSFSTLRAFWIQHPQAEMPMRAWHAVVSRAEWFGPADVRATFNSADFVADNRVIFNVGGNKYRLVARIAYSHQRVMVKFVGTHKAYDKIDPEIV